MSEDKSKKNLLTSELDFEGLDDMLASPRAGNQPDPFSDLVFEAPKEFVRKPEPINLQAAKITAPVRKAAIPAKAIEPPRTPMKKKIQAAPVKQDRFTLYAVAVVIVALFGISSAIYFSQLSDRNSAGLSYIVLPQNIVNIDGLVARVQATIQVDDADRDWLQANKKALGDSFARKFATLNLENLRSAQGIAKTQMELKESLNSDLNTDKVEAVLLTDLVIQEQS